MLEITNVSKQYPTPRGPLTVLENVSLTLAPGEAAAITGPSGSGKSSLLYMAGGLEPPSTGTITLGGKSVVSDVRNAEVGFVFQDHCLLPQCTVLENVLIPTLIVKDRAADFTGRARKLIAAVKLEERMDHRPAELSGGEKQRVAIARALIRHPSLVLCDEPTGNLDPATAESVSTLLLNLHRELQNILIVVTHSARLASQFPIRFELMEKRLNRI
jgi:lipoprotein-releasing system ATP-binding protein